MTCKAVAAHAYVYDDGNAISNCRKLSHIQIFVRCMSCDGSACPQKNCRNIENPEYFGNFSVSKFCQCNV